MARHILHSGYIRITVKIKPNICQFLTPCDTLVFAYQETSMENRRWPAITDAHFAEKSAAAWLRKSEFYGVPSSRIQKC